MATSAKAQKLAAELADELRRRVGSAYIITEGYDTVGNPTIAMTDATDADSDADSTEDSLFIRVKPRDWALAKDIIGHDQTVYTPSVIQIAVEARTGVTTHGLAQYVTSAHAFAIFAACLKRGCRSEYWEETFGTPPTLDTFTDATKMIASNEPDLDWPLLSSQ
jgi:hypothetical protein